MKGRAIIRCRVCFGCGGRFVTEGFSNERLRLMMIKTESHYRRRKFFSHHQANIHTTPFSVIVGGADKCSGKKSRLNFFLNKPFCE